MKYKFKAKRLDNGEWTELEIYYVALPHDVDKSTITMIKGPELDKIKDLTDIITDYKLYTAGLKKKLDKHP